MKRFFNFLFGSFSRWFITLYISMLGSVMIFMENKSAILLFLSILSLVIFITTIIYAVVEVIREVKALIKKIRTLSNRILSPLERFRIEITFKV